MVGQILGILLLLGGSFVDGMTCPDLNEYSTTADLNRAWMCALVTWRSVLAVLKNQIEQKCPISDEDECWRSVFECPDLSDIKCIEANALQHETDVFNCVISYCNDGNYNDEAFLQKIWMHHQSTQEKFTSVFTSKLSQCQCFQSGCVSSATTAATTEASTASSASNEMTCLSNPNDVTTEAELTIVWMCELVNMRNSVAKWKQRAEIQCSPDRDHEENWRSMFECPEFSEVKCVYEASLSVVVDSFNCSILYCKDGIYADGTFLQKIWMHHLNAHENFMSVYKDNFILCFPSDCYVSTATIESQTESVTTASSNSQQYVDRVVQELMDTISEETASLKLQVQQLIEDSKQYQEELDKIKISNANETEVLSREIEQLSAENSALKLQLEQLEEDSTQQEETLLVIKEANLNETEALGVQIEELRAESRQNDTILKQLQDENSNETAKIISQINQIRAEVSQTEDQVVTDLNDTYTCHHLVQRDGIIESGFYQLGSPGHEYTVYCNLFSGKAITEVWHDAMEEIEASGCESPGCYSYTIQYAMPTDKILEIMNHSQQCRQYIEFKCLGASLLYYAEAPVGYWLSRGGEHMKYWGGASSKRPGYCACGETGTCIDKQTNCNCDKNSSPVTSDSGYLTDKTKLPVSEMRFGDMGSSSERGWHTLGKLECLGEA